MNRPVRYLLRLMKAHPLVPVLLLLFSALGYGYEALIARPAMVYMGIPQASAGAPWTWTRVLRNEGFLVGYSDLRGNPLWVTYRVRPIPKDAPRFKRPARFMTDWRNLTAIGHDDYTGSGYDRGHLAPNHAISRLYGTAAQHETFLMTNITPQRPALNQKTWQRLEQLEVDAFAPAFGEVWVMTGPVFDPSVERLKSAFRVEVPDAFFKIFVAPGRRPDAPPSMLAFVVPQGVTGREPLGRFVTSVDEVERLTGFDFFHELPDHIERVVEAKADATGWPLGRELGGRRR